MQKDGRLYRIKERTAVRKRRKEDKVLYNYNAILLSQLFQIKLLSRSHDQMGQQKIDEVYQVIETP